MRLSLATALILAAASPAQAAPYGLLHLDPRGARIAVVDLGSIQRGAGARVTYDVVSFSHLPYWQHLEDLRHRKEADCREPRSRLLEIEHSMDGGPPKRPPWAKLPGEWTEADPVEFSVVCRSAKVDRFPTLEAARATFLELRQSDPGRRR